MKWLKLVSLLWITSITVSHAYVLNINVNNAYQHWDLINLPIDVPTNSVNRTTRAIRYYLASDAFSTTNTAAELNSLRACIGQWMAVSNTVIKFEEAGLVNPPIDINTGDGTNVFYWVKNTTFVNGGVDNIAGASGVTYVSSFEDDNVIVEADIVFNAYTNSLGRTNFWFTDFNDTANTNTFIEGVALHELGHFLGLAHSPVGGATMLFRGSSGVNNQAGLSTDDVCGGRFLYTTNRSTVGAIRGTVTKSGNPVLGAAVFVETTGSNVVAGTVSRSDGTYEINSLPPGSYFVRVAPLDPNSGSRLVAGPDIGNAYGGADVSFFPTANVSSAVVAQVTNTVDFAVTSGSQAFRIAFIRTPSANSGSYSINSSPTSLRAGTSNRFVSVFSSTLPTSGATFTISGDGLTLGAPTFQPGNVFVGLNGISMSISVSSNATPGLRDFIVTQGGNVAYANAFFEVLGTNTDYNFDGLEDTFQRQYFPVFTSTDAGPNADPDGDKMNNAAEYIAGTIPTNAASLLQVQSVARTNTTATVRWSSVTGKKYQLSYRTNIAAGVWSNAGSVVTASGTTSLQTDATADTFRFYRVQVVP